MRLLEDLEAGEHSRIRIWEIGQELQSIVHGRMAGTVEEVKACLQSFPGLERQEIVYDMHGKPYLSQASAGYISLSHSHQRLALIHDRKEGTGIDIERIGTKILRVRHKFMGPTEMAALQTPDDPLTLHVYWGAKEVLYKFHGTRKLIFSENLRVLPFRTGVSGNITGQIRIGESVTEKKLEYRVLGDYVLVYLRNS